MNEYIPHIPAKFLVPLNMNGMSGRMLNMPATKNKKREILVIYGHHATLERMYSTAQVLNRYGSITMPDLPGFGGMDSFYKIGRTPSLDSMADYLAAFIKLRYKKRQLSLVGFSYGFLVITRMLQNYPEIAKQVNLLVSAAGFAHNEDFKFSRSRKLFYKSVARFVATKPGAFVFHNFALNPVFLKTFYSRTHNAKHKFGDLSEEQKKAMTEFEILLWRINDARTYGRTTITLMTVDNCKKQVNLAVWHIWVKADHFFDNDLVEQHMKIIFTSFNEEEVKVRRHNMNVIADKKETAVFIPPKIRRELNKKLR